MSTPIASRLQVAFVTPRCRVPRAPHPPLALRPPHRGTLQRFTVPTLVYFWSNLAFQSFRMSCSIRLKPANPHAHATLHQPRRAAPRAATATTLDHHAAPAAAPHAASCPRGVRTLRLRHAVLLLQRHFRERTVRLAAHRQQAARARVRRQRAAGGLRRAGRGAAHRPANLLYGPAGP